MISICVHFYSLKSSGYTPPQTVNVTDSVKFPRHCERGSAASTKGQDWSFYFLFSQSSAPTTAAFQHGPGHDSLKHYGLQMALIYVKWPIKRFVHVSIETEKACRVLKDKETSWKKFFISRMFPTSPQCMSSHWEMHWKLTQHNKFSLPLKKMSSRRYSALLSAGMIQPHLDKVRTVSLHRFVWRITKPPSPTPVWLTKPSTRHKLPQLLGYLEI